MGDHRRLRDTVILTIACLAVAGCGWSSSKRSGTIDPKYGVAASPKVVSNGKKVPVGGGRYMVGKPYTIAGKRYYPRLQKNYVRTGRASWYGAAFHGRKTANGEIYDMNALTAAHPTMPLPSYARVTNVKNGRSVIVRVNDRGPFHGGRVIDLSKRVAEVLDFKRTGIARVRVRYVGRARLDGRDHRYLVASYRGSGRGPGSPAKPTMIARASVKPPAPLGHSRRVPKTRAQPRPRRVILASHDRDFRSGGGWERPESRPARRTAISFAASSYPSGPVAAVPIVSSGPPATGAPMVLFDLPEPSRKYIPTPARSSLISSYTVNERISAAFSAIDELSLKPAD